MRRCRTQFTKLLEEGGATWEQYSRNRQNAHGEVGFTPDCSYSWMLSSAFTWAESPEGRAHWLRVRDVIAAWEARHETDV